MNTKKICLIGILTAMYCALSALMKFTVIGNIQIDIGYIALVIACAVVGPWAGFVGAVGCALESILFSAYGFSISWFVANLIIGLGCGYVFKYEENIVLRIISIVFFSGIGLIAAKTGIECMLYHIPIAVKIPKNLTAFGIDVVMMLVGLPVCNRIKTISLR